MNCKDMMQIPELTEVLKLKAGENGLQKSVRVDLFCGLSAMCKKRI